MIRFSSNTGPLGEAGAGKPNMSGWRQSGNFDGEVEKHAVTQAAGVQCCYRIYVKRYALKGISFIGASLPLHLSMEITILKQKW